jgi:hypothetical protein
MNEGRRNSDQRVRVHYTAGMLNVVSSLQPKERGRMVAPNVVQDRLLSDVKAMQVRQIDLSTIECSQNR